MNDKIFETGDRLIQEDSNAMWNEMSNITRRIAKEVIGESNVQGKLVELGCRNSNQ